MQALGTFLCNSAEGLDPAALEPMLTAMLGTTGVLGTWEELQSFAEHPAFDEVVSSFFEAACAMPGVVAETHALLRSEAPELAEIAAAPGTWYALLRSAARAVGEHLSGSGGGALAAASGAAAASHSGVAAVSAPPGTHLTAAGRLVWTRAGAAAPEDAAAAELEPQDSEPEVMFCPSLPVDVRARVPPALLDALEESIARLHADRVSVADPNLFYHLLCIYGAPALFDTAPVTAWLRSPDTVAAVTERAAEARVHVREALAPAEAAASPLRSRLAQYLLRSRTPPLAHFGYGAEKIPFVPLQAALRSGALPDSATLTPPLADRAEPLFQDLTAAADVRLALLPRVADDALDAFIAANPFFGPFDRERVRKYVARLAAGHFFTVRNEPAPSFFGVVTLGDCSVAPSQVFRAAETGAESAASLCGFVRFVNLYDENTLLPAPLYHQLVAMAANASAAAVAAAAGAPTTIEPADGASGKDSGNNAASALAGLVLASAAGADGSLSAAGSAAGAAPLMVNHVLELLYEHRMRASPPLLDALMRYLVSARRFIPAAQLVRVALEHQVAIPSDTLRFVYLFYEGVASHELIRTIYGAAGESRTLDELDPELAVLLDAVANYAHICNPDASRSITKRLFVTSSPGQRRSHML
jgi:hypothetical protein